MKLALVLEMAFYLSSLTLLCGVQVPRADGIADGLGLLVLDEPSVKQSDPTVMSLWLSEETKQHGATEVRKPND